METSHPINGGFIMKYKAGDIFFRVYSQTGLDTAEIISCTKDKYYFTITYDKNIAGRKYTGAWIHENFESEWRPLTPLLAALL
jgi:hypothetical protein